MILERKTASTNRGPGSRHGARSLSCANSKVSCKQAHAPTPPPPPGRKDWAAGGLILISPQRNLPHRSGTYSNLKPSCLLQCCKIYKRITSLNRLALQTQMQTSHNIEGAGQEEEKYSQKLLTQIFKSSLHLGASLSEDGFALELSSTKDFCAMVLYFYPEGQLLLLSLLNNT